jgi:hypothetical protein
VLSARKNKVETYFSELYPPNKTQVIKLAKVRQNHRIITRGFTEGKTTTISQPLPKGSAQEALLLT